MTHPCAPNGCMQHVALYNPMFESHEVILGAYRIVMTCIIHCDPGRHRNLELRNMKASLSNGQSQVVKAT